MSNIWSMSGAELAREISQPAPVSVLRGGHASPTLAGVLSQIASLPSSDRDELLKAFQAALKPETKRIGGGQTYRNAEAFFADFNAAREACRQIHGESWYLSPTASLKARVPGAWVALRGEMKVWHSPRDVNMPRAEYWPSGALPTGPEYAEHGLVCPIGGAWAERAKPKHKAVAFNLEPTPEEIELDDAA